MSRKHLATIKDPDKEVPKIAREMCAEMLKELERANRPVLEAIKCSLDNSFYDHKVGYLTPGEKTVKTELNVSSVLKMSRSVFLLEILLRNLDSGAVNTKRELYYIAKGECKQNKQLKPLDFNDQVESDSIIDFICELMEIYREEINCFANDRGGQTYCQNLIVTEHMPDGTKATIDLSSLGTTPFQPKTVRKVLRSNLKKEKSILSCCGIRRYGKYARD